jgi:hypothetical protein
MQCRLKWVITWPDGFVVLVMNVWGQGKNIGTEVIWVMIAWLDAIGYIMQWVMARLLHGCIAGVHATEHSSQVLSIHVQQPVQQYCYSVPWYSRRILCSCAYVACAATRDLCDFVTNTTVNLMWLSHTPSFPTPMFHTCVYTFLFVFSRQYRNRGDVEMCRTVFLPLNQFRMFCTHVFPLLYCGGVDRIPRNL